MVIEIMLVVVIGLLIFLICKLSGESQESKDVEQAITRALSNMGISDTIGQVRQLASEIRSNQKSFEEMLINPTKRGAFGELSLEVILSDQLPRDMFGIRKKVSFGKTPDAHINSTVGIICIDSKFPLTNYRRIIDTDDKNERKRLRNQFISDVKGHLAKIAEDYVCPELGSAEFAFAFIPSEAVYWYMVNECFDTLREFSKKGVQVVSPITLTHKIELIKAGVHAKKLSENAERVQRDLQKLSKHFRNLENLWSTLYETHLHRLKGKADDFDEALKLLRHEFRRIESLEQEYE